METFFGILVAVVLALIVLRPVLAPLFRRWAMGKMEDNFRRMAGMPTRKEERKARKRAEKEARQGKASARAYSPGPGSRRRPASAVSYLRSFAEDVEYVEIKEYSSDAEIGATKEKTTVNYKVEEQVEDAEFTEIKSRPQKRDNA